MRKYVDQIIRYLRYLSDTYGWQITIHDLGHFTFRYMQEFLPFRVHSNSYCVYLKNTPEIWEACISRQKRVLNSLEEPIRLGMCHCGVEEYILPLTDGKEKIGFVSISGYRKETEKAMGKIAHICDKYQLNREKVKKIYREGLSDRIPDKEQVYTLAAPLVIMLEHLYLKEKEKYPECFEETFQQDTVLDRVLQYLEHFYAKPVKVQELCTHCGCSRSYLSHMFKKQTGKNISQYINELRIAEARILLADTDDSITDIALSTGFSSLNYFTGTFRKLCGCSPTFYRKEEKKKRCTIL